MNGQDVFAKGGRLVFHDREGYAEGNFFQSAGEFIGIMIAIGGVRSINKHGAYVSGVHVIYQFYDISVYTLAIVYRVSPIHGLAGSAEQLVDRVDNHQDVGVIASADDQGVTAGRLQLLGRLGYSLL